MAKNVYIATGSNDGCIGAFTSAKNAKETAARYLNCEISDMQIDSRNNGAIVWYETDDTTYVTVERMELNAQYY